MVWKPSMTTCSRSRACAESTCPVSRSFSKERISTSLSAAFRNDEGKIPGPGAGVEQSPGNDAGTPERLGERTHDGRRCVECRQRRIAHALHEVFIPLFTVGIMAQQFVQFPHLREEFPVYLSLREIVVRSGRLQDAFQRSEAAVRSQGISLLRAKYRRWSESDAQGGDVRLQMFPFIVCHAVRCGFG